LLPTSALNAARRGRLRVGGLQNDAARRMPPFVDIHAGEHRATSTTQGGFGETIGLPGYLGDR